MSVKTDQIVEICIQSVRTKKKKITRGFLCENCAAELYKKSKGLSTS